jgi:hypothetical protein
MRRRHRHKTWSEAAGLPETSARLDRLPKRVKFREDFPEPIHYDRQGRCLVYRGFMASASYRFLHSLSTDSDYLTALDQLYEASAYALPGPGKPRHLWVWLFWATALAAAALGVWSVWRWP